MDTEFNGKHTEKDEEELARDVDFGEALAQDAALGLSRATVQGGGTARLVRNPWKRSPLKS